MPCQPAVTMPLPTLPAFPNKEADELPDSNPGQEFDILVRFHLAPIGRYRYPIFPPDPLPQFVDLDLLIGMGHTDLNQHLRPEKNMSPTEIFEIENVFSRKPSQSYPI